MTKIGRRIILGHSLALTNCPLLLSSCDLLHWSDDSNCPPFADHACDLGVRNVSAEEIQQHSDQIDQVVQARLAGDGQERRPEIDDYTFCRRVYLDAIGRIPTVDELDAFIRDVGPDKRSRLIGELLESKGYQSHWYNYWADLLRVKYVGDKLHHPGNYGQWIKEALRTNKPYDQMVHELVNAGGPLYKPGNGATGFYAREPMPLDHLANSVKTFLGLSIECA